MMRDDQLPDPPIPADVDLRGVPMPRGLLLRLLRETFGLSEREAEVELQKFFAERRQ